MCDSSVEASALREGLEHVTAEVSKGEMAGMERVLKGWLVVQRTKVVRGGGEAQESSSSTGTRSGGADRVLVLTSAAFYALAYRKTASGAEITRCDR
jgi:hypothetical protein